MYATHMKYSIKATIKANTEIAQGHFELIMEAPEIAKTGKPGQFIQIKLDKSLNPLLPRPMGLSFLDEKQGCIGVIYKIAGYGTSLLQKKIPNQKLIVTGPLGNSFTIYEGVKNIALIAGGTGIGPILLLSEHVKATMPHMLAYCFLGARSKPLLCGKERLNTNCVQTYFATDDGTEGHYGVITDILLEKCKEHGIKQIIAVGPTPMMQKAVAVAKKLGIRSEVSLEERMACGFGICLGCAAKLKDDKFHMICVDGPIFNGDEVF